MPGTQAGRSRPSAGGLRVTVPLRAWGTGPRRARASAGFWLPTLAPTWDSLFPLGQRGVAQPLRASF